MIPRTLSWLLDIVFWLLCVTWYGGHTWAGQGWTSDHLSPGEVPEGNMRQYYRCWRCGITKHVDTPVDEWYTAFTGSTDKDSKRECDDKS